MPVKAVSEISACSTRERALIAVDLGGTKCHGVLADPAGVTLAEERRATGAYGDAAATLLATITALRAVATAEARAVRAVVIGVPAVPDPDSGLIVAGPNVAWSGFDLVSLLREHVPEPCRVENDVTLAAIGEAWRGDGRGADGFVVLSIGTGVGGAVWANGGVIHGRHNAAGELGALLTARAQLRAAPGVVAGLEAVASGPAIERRAAELADGAPRSATAVLAAAAAGEAAAGQVVEELLDHVAMAIVDVVAVVDPERVILDGTVGRALAPFADAIAARVARRVADGPELHISSLGPNATLVGAIATALETGERQLRR
jgi:glucokinase